MTGKISWYISEIIGRAIVNPVRKKGAAPRVNGAADTTDADIFDDVNKDFFWEAECDHEHFKSS